ncbi:hypothetical protein M3640_21255, partial [Bacillus velezensis]|nr:hypothetical protein [Bacillus velezensis]
LADGGRLERVEHFMLTSSGRRTVRLAADRIALSRQFSDRAVERVLTRLARRATAIGWRRTCAPR